MNLLVDSTIKVSLVVVLGLTASALLQRRSAALRHWVLTVSIVCSAAMPLLAAVVPTWRLVVPTWHLHLGELSHPRLAAPPAEPPTVGVGDGSNAVIASQPSIERRSLMFLAVTFLRRRGSRARP